MQPKLRDNSTVYLSKMKIRLRKQSAATKQADKKADGQQTNKVNLASFSVLCAIIIFLSFACGDAERTTDVVTAPEDAAEKLPMGQGLDIGALAPEFSLPDSDGEFHSLSEYRGQKLVIVFYRTGT